MGAVALPSTANAVYAALEAEADREPREHFGLSGWGDKCERKMWYGWIWSHYPEFPGRILRLFRRGQNEEEWVVRDLRAAGLEVLDRDPRTGDQFRVARKDGVVGGSMDGIARNVPESSNPTQWHALEIKTCNKTAANELQKKGVEEAQPKHYRQMQGYMHFSGDTDDTRLTRAIYVSVCKDDDRIYVERVKYDKRLAERLADSANEVVTRREPFPKISDSPAFFECKFCDAHEICHNGAWAEVNCRTCIHGEVVSADTWLCGLKNEKLNKQAQLAACPSHLFLPSLVPTGTEVARSEKENWVEYKTPTGVPFKNGIAGPGVFASSELRNLDPSLYADGSIDALRMQFGARVVEPIEPGEFIDDEIPF